MMADMDPPTHRYGPPPGAFVLWGGPADGQAMTVERCTHGDWPDVHIPMTSHKWPAPGIDADTAAAGIEETKREDVRYSYNETTARYEYVPMAASS